MTLRSLLLLPLLAACSVAGAGPREPDPVLRVLVYNVHAGKDAGGAHNLERVAGEVRESGADLVLLQEVDRGTERSGREDQIASLARLTGFHGAFGRTIDFQGGEYGIAALSRWPIAGDTLLPLIVPPPGGAYEPRGALLAAVAAPWGRLHLLNTHLDASADDRWRVREAARVRALADSLRAAGGVVLAGGDLNSTPESPVIAHLAAAGWRDLWAECGSGPGLTFPAAAPARRIDYLFAPPGLACRSAEVLPSGASDHRPVLFVLTWKGEP